MSESGVSGDGTPPSEDIQITESLESAHIFDSTASEVLRKGNSLDDIFTLLAGLNIL